MWVRGRRHLGCARFTYRCLLQLICTPQVVRLLCLADICQMKATVFSCAAHRLTAVVLLQRNKCLVGEGRRGAISWKRYRMTRLALA
jgi:hypothetical protein